MTKGELIEIIAQREDFNLKRAELVVNTVFGAMSGALEDGDRVEIRGFGSFEVRNMIHWPQPQDGRRGECRCEASSFFQNG